LHTNLKEVILGHGHLNVLATHRTTLEFTRESRLSKMGDCIVTVGTDKAAADLNGEFSKNLANDNAKLTILIEVGDISERIIAQGSSRLALVIRKSGYVCSRTLAIYADKAAKDLSRSLVERLKDPRQNVKITLAICH
jgi:hypothetical protein